jgi:hypothetical protein
VTKLTSFSSDDWIYWHFGYTFSLNYSQYRAIADLHNLQFIVAHALRFSVSTSRLLTTDLNTETATLNHYEVFLAFLIQSPWKLRTQLKLSWIPQAYCLLACFHLAESESYVMTDGQSASLSWYKAPIRGL